MYLNVFAAHRPRMIITVNMMRACECGCVNARIKFEAQGFTILRCETCQHAHGRDVKNGEHGKVWKWWNAQQAAASCSKLRQAAATCSKLRQAAASCSKLLQVVASCASCSKVQQAATSRSKLQQAAISRGKLQQVAARCNKLQQAAASCGKPQQAAANCSKLPQAAASCSKLQQAATSRNTLQESHRLHSVCFDWIASIWNGSFENSLKKILIAPALGPSRVPVGGLGNLQAYAPAADPHASVVNGFRIVWNYLQ